MEASEATQRKNELLGHGALNPAEWVEIAGALARTTDRVVEQGAILEIGTLAAKTTQALHLALDNLGSGRRIITVDTAKLSKGYWKSMLGTVPNRYQGTFVHGTSGDTNLQEDLLRDGIAFAFIDGCHCADCVRIDIQNLAKHMHLDGEIAFHDAGNQRELGMNVHPKYHGFDGEVRPYGVSEAIAVAVERGSMKGYERVVTTPPALRMNGPTPVFGGIQIWRRVE